MDDPAQGFMEGVRQCFHDLPDPRVVNRCQHRLLDILAIAILAVLSGADDWTDIEVFAETARIGWPSSWNCRAGFLRTTRFVACSVCSSGSNSRPVC